MLPFLDRIFNLNDFFVKQKVKYEHFDYKVHGIDEIVPLDL